MSDSNIIEQHRKESESLKQRLERLQAESSNLKIIIAERVSPDIDEDTLTKAENMQNQLIQKDEMIALMKLDIITFRNVVENEAVKDGQMNKLVLMGNKLRKEIETLEQKFDQLRSEFNHQLPGKL